MTKEDRSSLDAEAPHFGWLGPPVAMTPADDVRNPYLIQGPAQISFSGGRSSGMMLCKIVEAHNGTLPKDVVVTFANTGKEVEETLRFVQRIGVHLGVAIHWIEYVYKEGPQTNRWREVSFDSASRGGEPWAELRKYDPRLPNVVRRVCTFNLKVKAMDGFMRSIGLPDYSRVTGIRADEPRRIARMRARDDVEFVMPLSDAGVSRVDVRSFWDAMPFDLELPTINGETVGGNCDLCYLKGTQKIIGLIRQKPESADWWIEQETRTGQLFRIDRPNYAALKMIALQPQFDFGEPQEDSLPCECVD